MRLILGCLLALAFTTQARATDYQYKLYFGLSKPGGGAVSVAEWEAYEAEFAKVFAGFNVDATMGFYQSAKERSRIITLFMDDCREPALNAIVRTYVKRFGQDSVLVAKSPLESWSFVKKDTVLEADDFCGVHQ